MWVLAAAVIALGAIVALATIFTKEEDEQPCNMDDNTNDPCTACGIRQACTKKMKNEE